MSAASSAVHDPDRPALRRLADRVGIVSEYVDQSGAERRGTSDATCVALLRAMGIEATDEPEAERALAALARGEAQRLLAPSRVVRRDALADERVTLRLPDAAHGRVAWRLELLGEDGERVASEGELETDGGASLTVAPPRWPPLGYHALTARVRWADGEAGATQALIVVPDQCWLPADDARGGRYVGFTTNLYAARGAGDWGIGTTTELRTLMAWGGDVGADVVGVSPLHALWNRGTEVSPYSPVSRLYRNPLYLDVLAVPELAESDEARAILARDAVRDEIAALHDAPCVEYARIAALVEPLLVALHRTFRERHADGSTSRGRAYHTYRAEQGEALIDHATFLALDEAVTQEFGHPKWFRDWPEAYRDVRGDGVARFRRQHADRVDYYCWLQFELDRQLEQAAEAGRAAGMRIGLYQDLAIGSSGGGSDAWAYPRLLLPGVSVGAPPDMLGPQGQDWGLPPLDPRRLAESGYAYWIQLLRGAFRHAGALRIDHILGLFRQFWIPHGAGATAGAYVRFPSEALLGILALESLRHQAIVVGEDLGTVPPEVPAILERWRVLSSRVLYFEHDDRGAFKRGDWYPRYALATANTHDMAPLAGWWEGRDIARRADAGYMDDDERARQLAARRETARRLRERLAESGVLDTGDAPASRATLAGAVHDFLSRTPSMLVGFSLDDLAGESEPVNMPGLRPEEFASWTRRMARTVESLRDDPAVRTALGRAASAGGTVRR